MRAIAKGRVGRILEGWSANLVQTALGIFQQVALVPVFLHFWTTDVLAAWLALYSVGYLVLIADAGLQMRAINRFLAFRGCSDPDGRTAQFYLAMLHLYVGLTILVAGIVLIGVQFLRPSIVLGFSTEHFDLAFVIMTLGMILTLPVNLASALYRSNGLYGRIVKIQCWSMVVAQIGQLVAIVTTQSLLVVASAYASAQVFLVVIVFVYDVPRVFPFHRPSRPMPSWRWSVGQFRRAFPFAIVTGAEAAITYAPVLLVSIFVTDRVAVAQWALTRVIAGLVRGLGFQMTLPLAAELGHDHAVGRTEQLQKLYAHGSMFVTLLASIIISGLLAFWSDFFSLWTHNSIPNDPVLTVTLLIGTSTIAPSILALSYASYTDRGRLLAWTKGMQLFVFFTLSIILIPRLEALGAALAMVLSDLVIQFGILTTTILRQTLRRPLRHVVFLIILMVAVTAIGWAVGWGIRQLIGGGGGVVSFITECTTWLLALGVLAMPLINANVRSRLVAKIPY